ncbi:MAG: hypothetical protein ACI4WP_00825 [Bacilli bacterium]
MSKWKCEICEKEFDNFHAQGFDNKIYCPLCFFKEKTNRLEKENARLKEIENKLNFIKNRKNQGASQENINKMAIEFVNSYLKEVE